MTQSALVQAFLFLKNWRNAFYDQYLDQKSYFCLSWPSSSFDNANFELDTSWRLGLLGRNGRGKTTFIQIITK